MRRSALTAGVVAALAAGAFAPPASASDQSVYDAYVSRDADFKRLGKQFVRAQRTFRRSGFRMSRPVLRAVGRTVKLLDALRPKIAAEQPSTDAGRRGRAAALASVRLFRKSLSHVRAGVAALKGGRRRAGARQFRRANRIADGSAKAERRARKAFRQAGVTVK
jgi:hypothetical protein